MYKHNYECTCVIFEIMRHIYLTVSKTPCMHIYITDIHDLYILYRYVDVPVFISCHRVSTPKHLVSRPFATAVNDLYTYIFIYFHLTFGIDKMYITAMHVIGYRMLCNCWQVYCVRYMYIYIYIIVCNRYIFAWIVSCIVF